MNHIDKDGNDALNNSIICSDSQEESDIINHFLKDQSSCYHPKRHEDNQNESTVEALDTISRKIILIKGVLKAQIMKLCLYLALQLKDALLKTISYPPKLLIRLMKYLVIAFYRISNQIIFTIIAISIFLSLIVQLTPKIMNQKQQTDVIFVYMLLLLFCLLLNLMMRLFLSRYVQSVLDANRSNFLIDHIMKDAIDHQYRRALMIIDQIFEISDTVQVGNQEMRLIPIKMLGLDHIFREKMPSYLPSVYRYQRRLGEASQNELLIQKIELIEGIIGRINEFFETLQQQQYMMMDLTQFLSKKKEGLSKLELMKLKQVVYDGQQLIMNGDCCPICIDGFKKGQELRHLECNHYFHKGCLDKWLLSKAQCPFCKFEVVI